MGKAEWNFAQDKTCTLLCWAGIYKGSPQATPPHFCRHSGSDKENQMNFCSLKRHGNMQQNLSETPRWEVPHDSGMYHDNFGVF